MSVIHVANPIYDSVFKYIMEDDRIARTLLSALLKKDVVSVEVRPHEYANETKDKIAMFRIDFGARVRDADGKESLILIELQKTWVETETLRFRQYLGAQYNSRRNIDESSAKKTAYPMVSIYIMGHRVGDIEEPVLYVHHKAYDYDGREVLRGMPDPFVESLVHDSVIVQIPLLHGRVNKRLDKVLSVFDQTKADEEDPQLLCLDEDAYADDADMQYIVHRLTAAAANPRIRQDMNVEDEYFSAIEDRDTAIMNRDKRIKEQDGKIKEQDGKIKEQSGRIKEQDGKIKEQSEQLEKTKNQLRQSNDQLKEKDNQLKEQELLLKSLIEKMGSLGLTQEQIAEATDRTPEEVEKLLNRKE